MCDLNKLSQTLGRWYWPLSLLSDGLALEVSRNIFQEDPVHSFDLDNLQILDHKSDWFKRRGGGGLKEVIYIRTLKLSLNKDRDRYHLPRVCYNLLGSHMHKVHDLITNYWRSQLDSWQKLWILFLVLHSIKVSYIKRADCSNKFFKTTFYTQLLTIYLGM